jgi:CRISPR-associated protein Cmr5
MKVQTRQQIRAKFALENLPMKDGKVDKDTATFIVGSPTMVLTNGIGQALAFMASKKAGGPSKEGALFDIIKKWLCQEKQELFGNSTNSDLAFLKSFNSISQQEYIWTQDEVLKLLEWLKRYARAFQEEDKK